jgi:D-glycero-D-manno-heptose 1,7-bisphosphate phosphatase
VSGQAGQGSARGGTLRLVILDRDGVINEDSDDYIRCVADWRPLPGSLEAIAALHRAGFTIAIASNQSGVGRGLIAEQELERIHRHMVRAIEAAGGAVAGIYFCPHTPEDGCECRKPRPGLLLRIAADFGVDLAGVWFIGDKRSDLEAARAAGALPVLVRTGYGEATLAQLDDRTIMVHSDLASAVGALLKQGRQA